MTFPKFMFQRESPLDAVVMKKSLAEKGITKLSQLENTALIGSSSLRRQAQLKRKYKFRIESVRGNLNTRFTLLHFKLLLIKFSILLKNLNCL